MIIRTATAEIRHDGQAITVKGMYSLTIYLGSTIADLIDQIVQITPKEEMCNSIQKRLNTLFPGTEHYVVHQTIDLPDYANKNYQQLIITTVTQ